LHPTDRFYVHLDILLEALEEEGGVEAFETDLANALKTLEAYTWDKDADRIKPHGGSGRDFSYPINTEFLLVLRRDTVRDSEHKPILVHLYLKTIERVKV
jgi:hypothetical protein